MKDTQVSLKIMNLSKNDRYDNPSGRASHKEKHAEKDQSFGESLIDLREKNMNRPITG